ncbi:MAG: membrane protein [Minwuia thermotolerans]|nr:MAG: membrane protein [Minwuia thermotolerans]
MEDPRIAMVLRFWFEELAPEQHWTRDSAVDAVIAERFGALNGQAARGDCDGWQSSSDGALALVITLDQFSRNLFRDSPDAWANDPKALAIATAAVDAGLDQQQPALRRFFFYLPFEHSEVLTVQERCMELFGSLDLPETHMAAVHRHHEIIERFGRFPHRNAVLGRESTAEEIAFLKEPNSAF